jgi:hypothetical protein
LQMIKNLESLRIGEIVAFTTNQSNLPLLQPGRGTTTIGASIPFSADVKQSMGLTSCPLLLP